MNTPLVVGLAGPAGSGKTSVANALAPQAQMFQEEEVTWTHLFFALPIYRMATARQKIRGYQEHSRQAYEIEYALRDLFGATLEYDVLIDTVYEILAQPIEPEGIKPRTFLQRVGTEICRGLDPDCFVKCMGRKIRAEMRRNQGELAIVISDIRFINECEFIKAQPRHKLIRFEVDPAIAAARIAARDGVVMTEGQRGHGSESELAKIDPDMFDVIIDSSPLTLRAQVAATAEALRAHTLDYAILKETHAQNPA